MSSFINTLNNKQKSYIKDIVIEANKVGITNPYIIASILAVVSKESGFNPQNEISYKNTPISRIKKVFGAWRTSNKYSDAELETLKKNDYDFYEAMYGIHTNKVLGLGQEKIGDGYLFRGRGFNGLTGRGGYKKYSKIIGIDIESNPELVNRIDIALKILLAYFKNRIEANKLNLNNLGTEKNTLDTIYKFNAGGSLTKPIIDTTGGYNKAVSRYPEFKEYIINNYKELLIVPKKKNNIVLLITLSVIGYYIYKKYTS